MQFEEFVGQVQHRARLASQGEAMRAICATLETLGERLYDGEAAHVAAQLPPGIGAYLRLAKRQERFDIQEFFKRVAEREGAGVDVPDAAHHARTVIEVLQEAVTPGQLRHLREQLPDDYAPLFEAGSQGDMNINR
ncbi:MAG TPA: DUF2267 domain-containing protein [Caldilineaceae bacterium]|nr:DUF2267 domain-containing protein [Caldilineaceae bacterium]